MRNMQRDGYLPTRNNAHLTTSLIRPSGEANSKLLSCSRLNEKDPDVECDLKFILCEQDLTCLCGTQCDEIPRTELSYYRVGDANGNSVTVCVLPDLRFMH